MNRKTALLAAATFLATGAVSAQWINPHGYNYYDNIPQDTVVHPTIPGTTVRDWGSREPSYIYEPGVAGHGGAMYPTIPGTTIRDYGSDYPSYTVDW